MRLIKVIAFGTDERPSLLFLRPCVPRQLAARASAPADGGWRVQTHALIATHPFPPASPPLTPVLELDYGPTAHAGTSSSSSPSSHFV
jgi:hypothetical protein